MTRMPSTSQRTPPLVRGRGSHVPNVLKQASVCALLLTGVGGSSAGGIGNTGGLLNSVDGLPSALPSPRGHSGLCTCPSRPFFEAPPITVGVEQEFNGIAMREAKSLLTSRLGFVEAVQPSWLGWLGHADVAGKGAAFAHWRAVHDPTLSGLRSFELVSPPLTYAQVSDIADATRILVAHGATTDAMGALHVHVNHTSLTPANVAQLAMVVDRQQSMLMRLSRTSPRQAQYFCRPWEPGFVASLRAFPPQHKAAIFDAMLAHMPQQGPALTYASDAARYHLLNLQYLATGQTIEFRQYDATQSPSRVRAFVDLSLALTVAARDTDLGCLTQQPWQPPQNTARWDDAALFLDTIGLYGPALAASRDVLLQHVMQPPRPFEFAAYERLHMGIDLGLALAASWSLFGSGGGPRWLDPHIAVQGLAAAWRVATPSAESLGWTTYEKTHAMRELTTFLLPGMQAAYAALQLASGLKRVVRRCLA